MREMGEDFVLRVCGGGKSFSRLHQTYRQSIQRHGSRGHNPGCQEPLLEFFEHFFSMCYGSVFCPSIGIACRISHSLQFQTLPFNSITKIRFFGKW